MYLCVYKYVSTLASSAGEQPGQVRSMAVRTMNNRADNLGVVPLDVRARRSVCMYLCMHVYSCMLAPERSMLYSIYISLCLCVADLRDNRVHFLNCNI